MQHRLIADLQNVKEKVVAWYENEKYEREWVDL